MKKVLAVVVLFLVASLASASTVRGLLVRGNQPASGIAVTVSHPNIGRSQPSITGRDGFYYLYNVPAGYWALEVWANGPNNPPLIFNIVVSNQSFTDIGPINVR